MQESQCAILRTHHHAEGHISNNLSFWDGNLVRHLLYLGVAASQSAVPGFLLLALWREGKLEDPSGPDKHKHASPCCITM